MAQLRLNLAIFLAVVALEVSARASKAIVGVLQEHKVLACDAEFLAVVIHIFNSLPELLVERDIGGEFAQFRGDAGGNLHEFIVGIGAEERIEHVEHTIESGAAIFERHDSVVEIGHRALAGDVVDLGTLLGDTGIDSLLVVRFLDFIKRGHLMSCGKLIQENVLRISHNRYKRY